MPPLTPKADKRKVLTFNGPLHLTSEKTLLAPPLPGVRIDSKADFTRLSRQGTLGNFLRSWATLRELRDSRYRGWVTVRAHNKQNPWFVGWCHTHEDRLLGYRSLAYDLDRIREQGGPGPEAFFFQEVPPPDLIRTMNIEARYFEGVGLIVIHEPQTKNAVRNIDHPGRGTLLTGLQALALLQTLKPESLETLRDIWSRHPDSIIEGSEFPCRVGTFQQHLVVWEVRNY